MHLHAYYINDNSKNYNKIWKQVAGFTDDELIDLRDLSNRLLSIADRAQKSKVTLLIDAEQTYIQAAIDSFAVQMSDAYNTEEAMILNTFQNYLKSSTDRVKFEVERTRALGLKFGAKFVRGAYMREERELAKVHGYADPIHEKLEDTHAAYNANLEYTLLNMSAGSHAMVASHNEESVGKARNLVRNYQIKGKVSFAQLLGLADHLSFDLAKEVTNTITFENIMKI